MLTCLLIQVRPLSDDVSSSSDSEEEAQQICSQDPFLWGRCDIMGDSTWCHRRLSYAWRNDDLDVGYVWAEMYASKWQLLDSDGYHWSMHCLSQLGSFIEVHRWLRFKIWKFAEQVGDWSFYMYVLLFLLQESLQATQCIGYWSPCPQLSCHMDTRISTTTLSN